MHCTHVSRLVLHIPSSLEFHRNQSPCNTMSRLRALIRDNDPRPPVRSALYRWTASWGARTAGWRTSTLSCRSWMLTLWWREEMRVKVRLEHRETNCSISISIHKSSHSDWIFFNSLLPIPASLLAVWSHERSNLTVTVTVHQLLGPSCWIGCQVSGVDYKLRKPVSTSILAPTVRGACYLSANYPTSFCLLYWVYGLKLAAVAPEWDNFDPMGNS